MTVVFVYSDRNRRATAPSYFDFTLAAFQHAGAMVIEEDKFAATAGGAMVPPGDRLVNFYCDRPGPMWSRCLPQFRWNYAIDEVSRPNGVAYETRIKQCKEFDSSRIIITFMNQRHLQNLVANKISFVGMPFCPPRARSRTSKPNAIIAVGSFHPTTYPERTRVRDTLVRAFGRQHVHEQLVPAATGEAFFNALDSYQMGVVCRAGYRDRLVSKYVEFGASHVLPIGDAPSYFPRDMRDAMVNTEGKSPQWITGEVNRLLHTQQELVTRQQSYTDATNKYFNLLQHADRVVKTVSLA